MEESLMRWFSHVDTLSNFDMRPAGFKTGFEIYEGRLTIYDSDNARRTPRHKSSIAHHKLSPNPAGSRLEAAPGLMPVGFQ